MVAIERPFSWFLGTRGLLLFNEMWLWRQNFFRMARLSFQWQAATLKDIKRLWKRNGGNRRPFSWFLGTRGLLLFNEMWLWRQNFFRMARLSFQWQAATLKDIKRLWKRNGGNRRPFSWFLGTRGLLLFNEMWLWRQNFFRMARLSFQWPAATLKDIKRLWKRNGGNQGLLVGFWGPGAFCYLIEKAFFKMASGMTCRNSQGYNKAVEEKWWQSEAF